MHPRLSKNAFRRHQKKARKEEAQNQKLSAPQSVEPETDVEQETDVEAESTNTSTALVQAAVESNGVHAEEDSLTSATGSDVAPESIDESDPLYEQFKDILKKFSASEPEQSLVVVDKPQVFYDDDSDAYDEEKEVEQKKKIGKKRRKMENLLSIAELKASAKKPELVDWHDRYAPDPLLNVAIKSHRNVIPVPLHWSLKREYLSSKRGIEKPPWSLPKFLQDTGISEMRDAVLDKQADATLKQKQRERVAPKMGKLDIDYSVLRDAFFRFQVKPELTRFGEVYYEGKEYETNLKHLRPGEISDELKEALNMPPGAAPPWLLAMQRFGAPPSYPALKIPGLNAPPPPGAVWGYHTGGWGKPPTDEKGNALFDVLGIYGTQPPPPPISEQVEKTIWGELQEPEEESEEEEEDDDEEGSEEEDIGAGLQTPGGLETPSGMTSAVPTELGGAESVGGEFTLRKQKRGTETEESKYKSRSAGQVLQEKKISTQGFFGGERAYDISSAQQNRDMPVLGEDDNRRKRKAGDVDVSVDVDALERDDKLSKEQLKKEFEANREDQKNPWGTTIDQEDLSQMIADESRKRQKRDDERRRRR
ncbi:DUF382-domain-containing protein [Rhizodiscina lignyota]|uniref:DUF382-domain-containing protein n=1 Tax=Rhizodiscina lignyota TaxID=1504668 RepID=A0A9P4I3P2_9PEZI|nr:DUF382-domain-containing protein [Rhizodiscina lignyota]